jgi:uncharacterized protein YndB with AHSA1/START domain
MSDVTPNLAPDLVLERTIPGPPERIRRRGPQPELLTQWFTPGPWRTVTADLDVRPTTRRAAEVIGSRWWGGRRPRKLSSPPGDRTR